MFDKLDLNTASVSKTLNMDNTHNHLASKIPVPARNIKTLTAAASSQAGKTKVSAKEDVPLSELEKLDSLRSKLEQSADAFVRARKELEEILPVEGSSEQGRSLTGSSVDLKTELRRHRELTSRVASSLKGRKDPDNHTQGLADGGKNIEQQQQQWRQ
ncbi:centromere protein R isoform X3 [Paralichthys olivaceus]|uniref:centromere protein R isoform X3 n=1 Tax=Paralichthys olivaceus TaxID=8255 RepID=UPI003750C72F